MGGLLLVASAAPPARRATTLHTMAKRSPHRGALRFVHAPGVSIAVQARAGEASLYENAVCICAVHGRAYDLDSTPKHDTERTSARTVADAWTGHGQESLAHLDGEYALCIFDKRSGAAYLCVSLMMTKPLYWGRNADELCLAPEIRQCAAGIGEPMRLDPAEVAMTFWLGGPILNRERTEYRGIDRLVSPDVYRINAMATELTRTGRYYVAPPPLPEAAFADGDRAPTELIATLERPMCGLPDGQTAMAFSAGHDSGLLYILSRTRNRLGPRLYGLTYPGSFNDERPGMEELAKHFGDYVHFIDASNTDFSTGREIALRMIDIIPQTSTRAGAAALAHRANADGMTHCLTGIGAEAALMAGPGYLLDLLRRGRILAFLLDALRFRPYSLRGAGLPRRLRYMARRLLIPQDSPLGRRWEQKRFRSAGPKWQPMLADALDALADVRRGQPKGRAQRLTQVRFHNVLSGSELVEQLFEMKGLSVVQPYAHRRVMDFGLRTPARVLSGGSYEKHIQRTAAGLLLGHDPPWPRYRVSAAAVNQFQPGAKVDGLGPPADWCLVNHEILTPQAAHRLQSDRPDCGIGRRALTYEAYLRHHGT